VSVCCQSDMLLLPASGLRSCLLTAVAPGAEEGAGGQLGREQGGAEAPEEGVRCTKEMMLQDCLRVATIDNFQVGRCIGTACM
jgi:hypothetical protein